MPVQRILNRCTSERMPFRWTINPYRGCEFGCVIAMRDTRTTSLELRDPMDFERRIFAKRDGRRSTIAHAVTHAHRRRCHSRSARPRTPISRRSGSLLTRSMLEVFANLSGLNLSITTKSALVTAT